MSKSIDGVSTYAATQQDLDLIDKASARRAEFASPVLRSSANEYLFVAAFDGTGNTIYKDKVENHTNVGQMYTQIRDQRPDNTGGGYVEEHGTQDNWLQGKCDTHHSIRLHARHIL